MWPGPVFHIELLRLARQPRYYLLRFIYGSTILIFLGLMAWSFSNDSLGEGQEVSINRMATFGQGLLAVLAFIQSIALLILTPALVGGVIADERQRKTLDYLLTSSLTRPEIVLGKLFARLTHLGVFLTIGLPIMAITTFFGGVDPNAILLFFLASASAAIFLGSLSIAVSSAVQRPRDAISIAYSLEFCWLFVPLILSLIIPGAGTRGIAWEAVYWINQAFAVISPVFLYSTVWWMSSPQVMTSFFTMIGGQLVASAILLAIAIVNVRPLARKEGSSGGFWNQFKAKKAIAILKRPECFDDAMLWKEIFCSRKSFGHQILMTVMFVGLGLLVLYSLSSLFSSAVWELMQTASYVDSVSSGRRKELNEALRLVMSVGYVVLALSVATSAANSFTSEREQDTWVGLLASPLTALEMIRAKVLASFLNLKWMLAYLYGLVLLGMFLGAVHPLGLLLNLVVTAIYLTFASALGIYFSLRSRTSTRAMGFTIGTLLALNLGTLIFAAMWERSVVGHILFFGFSPSVVYSSLLSTDGSGFLSGFPPAIQEGVIRAVPSVIFAHLLAAFILLLRCLRRFDAWNDRPKTTV